MNTALLHRAGIALLAIVVFGYAAVTADFVALDDFKLIVTNPLLQNVDLASIKGMFSSYDPDLYVPLTLISYHVDRIVAGGFAPWMFHLTNLILHSLNAVLVSVVLEKLSGKRSLGLIAGLLFAVHPLHTEAVLWASARKDLLSTLFFLLTIQFYLAGSRSKSLIAYALGLLSKVSIVPLPIILILIDWYQGRSLNIKNKIPYFVLSIIFGIVALLGMEGVASQGVSTILLGSKAILFYLQKLILPTGLSVLVPYTDSVAWSNPTLLFAFAIVAAVTVGSIMFTRVRVCTFAWLFFVIMLIPSFGNFVKGNEFPLDVYLASDRYAYIPSIAILFLFALGIDRIRSRLKALGIFGLIGIFGLLSFNQSLTWRTTPELYFQVIEHYDNSHLAHNNIASMLIEEGHLDPAIISLKKSLEAKPNSKAFFNLGQIAEKKGDTVSAIKAYEKALEVNPYNLDIYPFLIETLKASGRPSEALQWSTELEKLQKK